ncbi:MAG: hypothetical protein LBD82_03135 [Deltaproteobacteria bacterium]|jgi:hypothetical protein|nr:hypothetical protein [Deltaproteobacteria bacterium]
MENYVANVIPHLQQWWPVLIVLAYLLGVIFVMVAAAQAINQKHKFSRSTDLWTFMAAVLLLNLPALMDSLSMTVFNQSSEQSLSYSPPSSPGSVYLQFAVYGIMTVGVIGITRGICLMRDTPNQAMSMSRGLIHLFGGILAVNIIPFLRGIGATLGGDVQTYIARIIG